MGKNEEPQLGQGFENETSQGFENESTLQNPHNKLGSLSASHSGSSHPGLAVLLGEMMFLDQTDGGT